MKIDENGVMALRGLRGNAVELPVTPIDGGTCFGLLHRSRTTPLLTAAPMGIVADERVLSTRSSRKFRMVTNVPTLAKRSASRVIAPVATMRRVRMVTWRLVLAQDVANESDRVDQRWTGDVDLLA